MEVQGEDDPLHGPRIVVIGCGGAGCTLVDSVYCAGIREIDTVAVDTDQDNLARTAAKHRVSIGDSITGGLGAGGFPDIGRRAAEADREEIEGLLSGADIVFLCAGLGGGTGTGASPVIARVAKEQGALVIGVVSLPFRVEQARLPTAKAGLRELLECTDTLIVLDNEQIFKNDFPLPHLPYVIHPTWRDAILEIIMDGIVVPVKSNQFEWDGFREIFSKGGVAALFVGESNSSNVADSIVRSCLSNSSFAFDRFREVKGSYILVFGETLTQGEVQDIAAGLLKEMPRHIDVLYGGRENEKYRGILRAICVLTGIPCGEVNWEKTRTKGGT